MVDPRKPSDEDARRERASLEAKPRARAEADASRPRAPKPEGAAPASPQSSTSSSDLAKTPAPSAKGASRDAVVSPMASPVAHASPIGTATSALAPATAAPSLSGPAPPRPRGTTPLPGEVAAAAATILSGGGSDQAAETTRETLEESAQLARTSASARARVAGLRARGASLPELDGRLAAADLLARRGEPAAAQKILEEVLVLSNALVSAFGLEGPIDLPDPLDARIDEKLERVLEKASEAARTRTDELLASARLAEKVEEVARARAEELLASKRLTAKIEEVAQKHAEEVARGAVEALLSSEPFKQAVDARARARAEEAFAGVKGGASPEAIEAAAERALARREKETSSKLDRALDPEALERRLVPLVSSLVKAALSNEQAVQNKIRSMISEEVAKTRASVPDQGDDEHVRRLVVAEIVRREAMSQAKSTGEGLSDRATAIARSEAMQQVLQEQFQVLRASLKAEVIEELERIAAANKKRMLEQRPKP